MGTLVIMGRSGDAKVAWDVAEPAQVETAMEKFKELKSMGYLSFRVAPENGGADRQLEAYEPSQIDVFEPDAERILMIPPVMGG